MNRMPSWAPLGTEVLTKSVDEALKKAELDYDIITVPIAALPNASSPVMMPKLRATMREDNQQIFGIVTERYQVIQNRDAFRFLEAVPDLEIVKAGTTDFGLVYIIAQMPEIEILGDTIKPHQIFQTGHGGDISLQSTVCMLRLACQNQFSYNFRNSPATIKIKHVGDVGTKLEAAQQTLAQATSYIQNYKGLVEGMATKHITPTIFNQILDEFFKIPVDDPTVGPRTIANREAEREAFRLAYDSDDNANIKGTQWGLVNAFTDYLTHKEVRNVQTRFLDSFNYLKPIDTFVNRVIQIAA